MFAWNFKKYVLIISIVGMAMPAHAGWWDDAVSVAARFKKTVSEQAERVTPSFIKSGYKTVVETVTHVKDTVVKQVDVSPNVVIGTVAAMGILASAAWYGIRKFGRQEDARIEAERKQKDEKGHREASEEMGV